MNIVKVYDFKVDGVLKKSGSVIEDDVAYAVLEVATNGEIFDVIFKTGALQENTLRYYLGQLIDVMTYLHGNNIVHRDLKPENILIGNQFEVKLADFGFATLVG